MKIPAKGKKWDHYLELKKDNEMIQHLPFTLKLSKPAFSAMLSEYPIVYLKPNRGAFGIGVLQVRKLNRTAHPIYRIHHGTTRRTFDSEEQAYDYVLANRVNKDYLVQEGIDLLRWNKRPFDLRLMMKKQENGTWNNEGFVGRVAQPGKIVTNIRSGGTAVSIEDLLKPHIGKDRIQSLIGRLNRLGSRICERLEGNYPGIGLFGVDIGLDNRLTPWIIEVNTRPEKICWKCMRKLYGRAAAKK